MKIATHTFSTGVVPEYNGRPDRARSIKDYFTFNDQGCHLMH